jgi:hypothetical protein
MVSVAQLVEHRSVAPRVAGSNPVAHPKPSNPKTKSLPIPACSRAARNFAQSLHTRVTTVAFPLPLSRADTVSEEGASRNRELASTGSLLEREPRAQLELPRGSDHVSNLAE